MSDELHDFLSRNPVLELAYGHAELAVLEILRMPRAEATPLPVVDALAHECARGLRETTDAGQLVAENYDELLRTAEDASEPDEGHAEEALPWPLYRNEHFYLAAFATLDAIAVACDEFWAPILRKSIWSLFRSRIFRIRHRRLPRLHAIEGRIARYDSKLQRSQRSPTPVEKGRWFPAVVQFTEFCYAASPLPESFPAHAVALSALAGLSGQLQGAITVLRESGY